RVTARQALELVHAERERIADDAALRAAEGNVDHGALPGHPCCQRLDLIEAHVLVEADAALGGPPRRVVQHAVPGEHLYLATVHHDRYGDRDLLLAATQDLV